MLISKVDSMYVFASCNTSGSERVTQVSVVNRATPNLGPLRDFSIGFCGPSVISVTAPGGWVSKIEGQERHEVTWSLPDGLVESQGVRSGVRVDGFILRLKPGWKRSRADSAWWGESNIVTKATTHDC